jgi:hypothetical protein
MMFETPPPADFQGVVAALDARPAPTAALSYRGLTKG